jgi:hypothetical protein
MGRKSKLKQARRAQNDLIARNPFTNGSIIDINPNDENWLYQNSTAFDPNGETVLKGTLDECIQKLVQDFPELVPDTAKLRVQGGEYGLIDGGKWNIIAKSLFVGVGEAFASAKASPLENRSVNSRRLNKPNFDILDRSL